METKRDAPIIRLAGGKAEGVIDEVASELPVRIVLNTKQLVTLLCTPAELEELVVGFLYSEGLLRDTSAITKLMVDEREATVHIELAGLPEDFTQVFEKRTISSGCGKGITFTNPGVAAGRRMKARGRTIRPDDIRRLLTKFRNISSLYIATGGVHSAALSDGKDILLFSEDIGRHNAVDKLIGKAFLRSIPLEDRVLLTSGRVTSEIVIKATRSRFPVLISRAAPSCMAISIAEDAGLTLIGFARGDRMNIYTWPDRIDLVGA